MSGRRDEIEFLRERIATLVAERQALRAAEGDRERVEQNRVEIEQLQQRLSYALIERRLSAAA